jgi:hypothetical protein
MRSLLDFFFPRQLRRLPYLIRALACHTLFFFVNTDFTPDSTAQWCGWILIGGYMAVFVILPRIRDIGMSRWWIVLAFIPYVAAFLSVVLLFRRSDPRRSPLLQRPPLLDPPVPCADRQEESRAS